MKKLILIIQIIILIAWSANSAFSQNDEFEKLVSYFKAEKNKWGSRENIPESLFYKFFDYEKTEHIVGIDPLELLYDSSIVIVLIDIWHPEGGRSSTSVICSFSQNGELLNKRVVGTNILDMDGGDACETKFYENSLLEVRNYSIGYYNDKEIISGEIIDYFQFSKNGPRKVKFKAKYGRKFPESSSQIIPIKYLQKYPEQVLDVMRNEIFAEHGYIFNTKKWKYYFEKQDWYEENPNFTNEQLTIIERINLKNLLEIKNQSKSF